MNDNYGNRSASRANWITPPSEQEGLSRYLDTIRERIWLIVITVAITTGIAILYVATATKTYESEAGLLVTPVPPEAELLVRVGLISESSDPGRDVQTVARLVTTPEVAARAQEQLGDVPEAAGTPQDLLTHVTAEPVAESNIVSITGPPRPPTTRRVSNAFAQGMIDDRTADLHRRVRAQLDLLSDQLQTSPNDAVLAGQSRQLEGLLSGQDPTLQIASEAVPPTAQASPRPVLSIAGGILAGIVLGIGAAFARQAAGPAPAPRGPAPPAVQPADPRPGPARGTSLAEEPAGSGRAVARRERGLPDPAWHARDLGARARGARPFDPRHRRVALRRQDHHGDQPLGGARRRRFPGDPDRGGPAPALDRADAETSSPAPAS